LQSEITNNQAALDIDMQGKCAQDSKVWFNEHRNAKDKDASFFGYTDHYNKSLNKCFILVELRWGDKPWASPFHGTISKSLWDVHENVQHADIASAHLHYRVNNEAHEEESVGSCGVGEKSCQSEKEFDDFVRPYMNN
jgi:hypothetical protein